MSKNIQYWYCIVPKCKNTSISAPDKQFISVPKDAIVRQKWCDAINRCNKQNVLLSCKSARYCCEDHFDLPNDMDNFIKHKIMGLGTRQLKPKKGILPHIFDCQRTSTVPKRMTRSKRRRSKVIRGLLGPERGKDGNASGSNLKYVDRAVQVSVGSYGGAMDLLKMESVSIKTEPGTQERDGGEMLYVDAEIDLPDIKKECLDCNKSIDGTAEVIQKKENKFRKPLSATDKNDVNKMKSSCSSCINSCSTKKKNSGKYAENTLLFEGDISDIELEEDNEMDEIQDVCCAEEGYSNQKILAHEIGMQIEVTNDSEDGDPPLDMDETQPPEATASADIRWGHSDLGPVNSECVIDCPEPSEDITAFQYFKYFIDDEMISNMVEQTNLYSVQKSCINVCTSFEEMEKFLGMHIAMGTFKLPHICQYWQEGLRLPLISDVMTINRFSILRSNFHLNDNSKCVTAGQPGHDKLFKVRPFVDALRHNLSKVEPEELNSIDVTMIPFKGRGMKHKPGIKMFVRAGVSGFVYDFEIYTGKDNNVGKTTALGSNGDVALRLFGGIPQNTNIKVAFDYRFTSHSLISVLKSIGIWSVGTARNYRLRGCTFKTDRQLREEGCGAYDYMTELESGVFALKWFDGNNIVHFASSYVGREPVGTVRRWSKVSHSHVDVPCPAIVTQYDSCTGGVELSHKLIALYRTDIRSKRFYLRIIFHLVDMCVVNAWLLYRRHCRQQGRSYKTLVMFRLEIGRALTSGNSFNPCPQDQNELLFRRRRANETRPLDDGRFGGWGHFPKYAEKSLRCKHCTSGVTKVKCQRCQVHLCFTPTRNCFEDFHARSETH